MKTNLTSTISLLLFFTGLLFITHGYKGIALLQQKKFILNMEGILLLLLACFVIVFGMVISVGSCFQLKQTLCNKQPPS